jgi:hypothetical protein
MTDVPSATGDMAELPYSVSLGGAGFCHSSLPSAALTLEMIPVMPSVNSLPSW